MKLHPIIHVIIPAFNEEKAIAQVIRHIPKSLVSETIVIDNGSTDRTASVASEAGATVLHEPLKGYGNACLKGIAYCKTSTPPPDILVFLDGDYSDYPEEMDMLTGPIVRHEADLVIGSRALGEKEKGSITIQQVFGNWLATSLMKIFFKSNFTDLGPFRAMAFPKLLALDMTDKNYGWTIEMQIKATKQNLRCLEVPVRYRKRIGQSKVSGTIKGTVMAGIKIIFTIFRYV